MVTDSVIATISEDVQSDIVAALHSIGLGHRTRVMRRQVGSILDQLERAGIAGTQAPASLPDAERVVVVNAAHRSQEIACLLLQRGATSSWTFSAVAGWQPIDDEAIEIAATSELPPRPVLPPHRSSRTFRQTKIRRRNHRHSEAGQAE